MRAEDAKAQEKKSATAEKEEHGVRGKITSIISRVTKIPRTQITGEKLIREELGVDSMQAIESLAVIEKELGIVIDPDRAFNVATVEDLFALVEESTQGAHDGL